VNLSVLTMTRDTLVNWNCNPRLGHTSLSKHLQCESAIPYAGVMTTIVTGNHNDSHPWIENRYA